jgi:hypothetical protein
MANQTMSGKTNYNTDPNHIYYDLQLYNNDCLGSSTNTPVQFTETRTSTILANPSEYFLTIARFNLDTPSLPVFLPEVQTDSTLNPPTISNPNGDPNLLIYQFCFVQQPLSGSTTPSPPYFQTVYFDPHFNEFVNPPNILDINALSNKYYFVNQFTDFLDMINLSLQRGAGSGTMPSTLLPPFFSMDENNRFQIYFPSRITPNTYNADGSPNTRGDNNMIYSSYVGAFGSWTMLMNAPLYNLFSSFKANYIGGLQNLFTYAGSPGVNLTGLQANQLDGWYQICNRQPVMGGTQTTPVSLNIGTQNQIGNSNSRMVSSSDLPFLGSRYTAVGNNATSFELVQQTYSSAPLWSCVKSLIFTTALMPVANSLVGLPLVQNSNKALDTDVQNNNFLPVITDLEVPLVRGDEIKPNIGYAPNGEYRLIDLQSNTPINSIEISVFWRDQYGTLHPFVLEPQCFASLKLLFRKKIFNLIYLPEYTKPAV